jgi:hypothetical protein
MIAFPILSLNVFADSSLEVAAENSEIIKQACKGLRANCMQHGEFLLQHFTTPMTRGYELERNRMSLILNICTQMARRLGDWRWGKGWQNERVACYERALTQMSGPYAKDALEYARMNKDTIYRDFSPIAWIIPMSPDDWYERALASLKARINIHALSEQTGYRVNQTPYWKMKALPAEQRLHQGNVIAESRIAN